MLIFCTKILSGNKMLSVQHQYIHYISLRLQGVIGINHGQCIFRRELLMFAERLENRKERASFYISDIWLDCFFSSCRSDKRLKLENHWQASNTFEWAKTADKRINGRKVNTDLSNMFCFQIEYQVLIWLCCVAVP